MDEKQADDGSTECEQAQKIPQRRAWEIHEQLRYGWPGARITSIWAMVIAVVRDLDV